MGNNAGGRAGRNGGTYAQMQEVLTSIKASEEQTRKTMLSIQAAMGMLAQFAQNGVTENNPQPSRFGGGVGGAGGGAPLGYGNQTRRPNHGNPVGSGGTVYGRGIAGVRSALAGTLNDQIGSGSGSQYSKIFDPETSDHVGWREQRPDGSVHIHEGAGAILPSALRAATRRGQISSVLGAFSHGGATGALRAIPYVGAAMMGAEAIHEGATFIANQREKNSHYQNVLGGSNMSGLGQRAQQFGFQLHNLFGGDGGMSWGQSAQAFQGVTALGYQGAQRSRDLSFISSNYKSMGVPVADSMKLIEIASKDLNESLTGLQAGLKATRDAALATGQSGAFATKVYTDIYGELSKTYNGPGVPTITGALATSQLASGRFLAHEGMSKMLTDPRMVMMMAPMVGMSTGDFAVAVDQGDPRVLDAMTRQIGRGGRGLLQNPTTQRIMNDVLSHQLGAHSAAEGRQILQSKVAASLLPHGKAFDPTNVLRSTAMRVINAEHLSSEQIKAQAKIATGRDFNDPVEAMMVLLDASSAKDGGFGLANLQKSIPKTLTTGDPSAGVTARAVRNVGRYSHGATVDAGKAGVNPTIDRINSMLKDTDRVLVRNGKHGQINVSYAQAKIHFPDQLANGTAIDVNSGMAFKDEGVPVEKKYLYKGDYQKLYGSDVKVSNVAQRDTARYGVAGTHDPGTTNGSANTSSGESVKSWTAQVRKDAGLKADITITAGPDLKRILHLDTHGNRNVRIANQNAAGGTTAQPGTDPMNPYSYIPGGN